MMSYVTTSLFEFVIEAVGRCSIVAGWPAIEEEKEMRKQKMRITGVSKNDPLPQQQKINNMIQKWART